MKLRQLAARHGGSIQGEPETNVAGVAPLDRAQPGQLAPFLHSRYLVQARRSRAAALLTDPELAEKLSDLEPSLNLWVHPQPRLALADLLGELAPEPAVEPGVHPTAVIHHEAHLDSSCRVEALVVIEAGATVGPRCILGARAFVGRDAVVGVDCRLGPGAAVLEGSRLGDRVRIGPNAVVGSEGFGFVPGEGLPRRVPQIGRVVLEDDVEIGALTAVDRATVGETVIRRGAKLDNLIQVGHNVEIGSGALIAAQSGLAGSSEVGAGALLGGQVGLGDHLSIGARSRLAGKSGVTGDVPEGATYAGYPAVPRTTWLRAWSSLLRWVSKKRKSHDRER